MLFPFSSFLSSLLYLCNAFSCRHSSLSLSFHILSSVFFSSLLQMACPFSSLPLFYMLEIGHLLLPTPKEEVLVNCWHVPGGWGCWRNDHVATWETIVWPRKYISLLELDETAHWILSAWWKLSKEQSIFFPSLWCLLCFLFLSYSIWNEEAAYCNSVQHHVTLIFLKQCAVLCLCVPTLESNYFHLCIPSAIQ